MNKLPIVSKSQFCVSSMCVSCFLLNNSLYSLSQVGVAEMKVVVERTGGIVVLAESFGHYVFKDSLQHIFQSSDNDLDFSFKLILSMLINNMY